jgi:phospholipid transport system substrate-binding protein
MSSPKPRSVAAILAAWLCLTPALARAAAEPLAGPAPRAIIEETVEEVLGILRDSVRSNAQRRTELEALALERFDFRTMSRLVLAKYWKRFDAEQRREFVEEFRIFLANDYGSRLERYEQEDVVVLGERQEPRGDVTVQTKIVGGENDGALVDYRMRNRKGEWRIIDVVIEGISLVANFRDQFREVMSRDGPDRLLEKLREKNAAAVAAPAGG